MSRVIKKDGYYVSIFMQPTFILQAGIKGNDVYQGQGRGG